MNVIDAPSLAKYVLREAGWREVRRALEEETVSVDHVLKEVANAIWKKAVILKLESVEAAWRRLHVLLKLVEERVVVVVDEQKYLGEAFKIAVEKEVRVYNALYIEQSIKLRAALVTSDDNRETRDYSLHSHGNSHHRKPRKHERLAINNNFHSGTSSKCLPSKNTLAQRNS